ncbi:uncharacterized protein BDV17DRAFT_261976 [Aspergillus undulatus]|uniref:uncharacterized protein n=1 Tax=Aspergillus undulatus TaxID=1810928 RepID=UPI003CCE3DC7
MRPGTTAALGNCNHNPNAVSLNSLWPWSLIPQRWEIVCFIQWYLGTVLISALILSHLGVLDTSGHPSRFFLMLGWAHHSGS